MAVRLPFLWDYDFDEPELHHILADPKNKERDWLIARILQHAPWPMIWKYLDLQMIASRIHVLPLPKPMKSLWEYALARWTSKTPKTY